MMMVSAGKEQTKKKEEDALVDLLDQEEERTRKGNQ
jgi:hypothetical protein